MNRFPLGPSCGLLHDTSVQSEAISCREYLTDAGYRFEGQYCMALNGLSDAYKSLLKARVEDFSVWATGGYMIVVLGDITGVQRISLHLAALEKCGEAKIPTLVFYLANERTVPVNRLAALASRYPSIKMVPWTDATDLLARVECHIPRADGGTWEDSLPDNNRWWTVSISAPDYTGLLADFLTDLSDNNLNVTEFEAHASGPRANFQAEVHFPDKAITPRDADAVIEGIESKYRNHSRRLYRKVPITERSKKLHPRRFTIMTVEAGYVASIPGRLLEIIRPISHYGGSIVSARVSPFYLKVSTHDCILVKANLTGLSAEEIDQITSALKAVRGFPKGLKVRVYHREVNAPVSTIAMRHL